MSDNNSVKHVAFLSKVTDFILDNYSGNIGELCVVFPNRRAGLFLKSTISSKLQKAFWSPAVYGIEDFICELAGKKITDNIRLLIELYDVHKRIEGKNSRSFDEFLNWGQILLADFNDVDLCLVNPDDLFGYLSESKAISLWNTDGKPLTEHQQKYLNSYRLLAEYYRQFSKKISSEHLAYQGMVYRYVAENIDIENVSGRWNRIIFAGFNALTAAEETIIKKLVDSGKADILWDTDKYYMQNELQEAGTIIRRNQKSIAAKDFKWLSEDYLTIPKNIQVIGAVNGISQAKVVGNIIKDFFAKDLNDPEQLLKTAIVLLDENLLLPLLYSLPSGVSQLNITMGYPLKHSSAYNFFDNLFELHRNVKRLGESSYSGKQGFYFKDVLKLFTHPYMMKIFDGNKESIANIILKKNKVFWYRTELLALFPVEQKEAAEVFKELLADWNSQPFSCFEHMKHFIAFVHKTITEEHQGNEKMISDFQLSIELEYLYVFTKIINNLEYSVKTLEGEAELKTLHNLFKQIVGASKLPFYGEPLRGLQLMGLLETRTLDFENLILLSANEGHLPSGKSSSSLIPYDIKQIFKMATYKDNDSVYAYHFYRLLQRAKNVYLLYNTEVDDLGKGERSRFVNQMINELPGYNNKVTITERIVSGIPEKHNIDYTISIAKDDIVYPMLKEAAVKGLSPSAINTYRNCKLRFYFQNIIRLKEMEDVMEKIDAATLGNIIHESLAELYEPYVNTVITSEIIEKLAKNSEDAVRKAFLNYFKSDEISYGKNYLIYKVALKLIGRFFSKEKESIEALQLENKSLKILALETNIEKEIKLTVNNDIICIKLHGKADRIDCTEEVVRIIDYKTGYFDSKDLMIKQWNDLTNKPTMDKCFQLLFYSYLAEEKYDKTILAGIISFKKLSEGFVVVRDVSKEEHSADNYLKSFDFIVRQILTDMFERAVPFDQTDDYERCELCPYNLICHRM
jgi:hypothetical protein